MPSSELSESQVKLFEERKTVLDGEECKQKRALFIKVVKVQDKENQFQLIHRSGEEDDHITVTHRMEGNVAHFDNLPLTYQHMLTDFRKMDKKKNPLICLSIIVQNYVDNFEGLRNFDQINQRLDANVKFKTTDPNEKYQLLKMVYDNNGGDVFKASLKSEKNKQDKKFFAIKASAKNSAANEAARVMGEHRLMQSIQSDYIMKAIEVFNFNERIVIVLDWMEGGALTDMINLTHETKHEDSCRYEVYCVAKGLYDLHKEGIVHRDIKSDNVLIKSDGTIKISDLGLACFLSQQRAYRKTK